jgi:hypothetical protein
LLYEVRIAHLRFYLACAFAFDVGEDGSKVGELIEQLRWLASMGIQTVLGVVPQIYRIEPLEVIGREVMSVVADL